MKFDYKEEKIYALISSQKMVQYMWKYTLHTQSTQIPCAVITDERMDFDMLAKALNIEIMRNDCLRLRFIKKGTKIKQIFLEEYKYPSVKVSSFSSETEQNEYFKKLSSGKLNIFGGETFRVEFFNAFDGKCGIYLIVSHVVMDAAATYIFFKDLFDVYDALVKNEPLPRELSKYEDIIKKELSDEKFPLRVKEQKKILEDFVKKDHPPLYCGINGPVALEKERKLRRNKELRAPSVYFPLFDKSEMLKLPVSKEESAAIDEYISEKGFSPEWVIQAGIRIYLSSLNYSENDTLLWVLCPRRKTVKEKRCGGTLASPLPWREQFDGNITFDEAVKQLASTQSFLFRYTDVPFTEIRDTERKLFGYSVMESANSMMFSYLPVQKGTFGDRNCRYTGFSMGYYVMPLYLIAMRNEESGNYILSYIYRPSAFREDEVRSFQKGVVRTIINGIKSPGKTITEITEEKSCLKE